MGLILVFSRPHHLNRFFLYPNSQKILYAWSKRNVSHSRNPVIVHGHRSACLLFSTFDELSLGGSARLRDGVE